MKRIKIYCDPMLTTMASIWLFVFSPFYTILVIWSLYFSESSNITTISDEVFSAFICATPFLNYILFLFLVPQHFSYVSVNKTGIKWVSPLKKQVKFSYEDFKIIKIAYYQHIYKKRFFLVMSRDFLSISDLTHINQLKCSDNLVKISITKRNYNVLSAILPDYIKIQLDEAKNNSDLCVNIDAEKIRLKRQNKKVKRKKNKKRR